MNANRKSLAREAVEKSLEIREEHGYDFRSPLCIYGLCEKVGVKVLCVDDINMEGIYKAAGRPTILISALRPLPRRAFTCGHELGHHVFGHGSTIDQLQDEAGRSEFDPKEFLVDVFSGAVLMPALGLKRAFSQRGIDPTRATPEQIFIVACSFGVGYETLVGQLAYGYEQISRQRAEALTKVRVSHIRQSILGWTSKAPLIVADTAYVLGTLDAEVGTLLLLPANATQESKNLEHLSDMPAGRLYRALRPGLARVFVAGTPWAVVVRVSKTDYAGLARYRHLEEADDE